MTWPGALTAAWGPARHSENTFLSLSRALRLGTAVFATNGQDLAPLHRCLRASQVVLVVKNLSAHARDKRRGFDPWGGKSPWRRAWQPTPVGPSPRPSAHPGESRAPTGPGRPSERPQRCPPSCLARAPFGPWKELRHQGVSVF